MAQETPPQHFMTPRGDYHGGKPPFRCRPVGNGSFGVTRDHALEVVPGSGVEPDVAEWVLQHGWRNNGAQEAGTLHVLAATCWFSLCMPHASRRRVCIACWCGPHADPDAHSCVGNAVQPGR